MYKSTETVLCMPAIEELTRFGVIDDNSKETAWKKAEICSESISSGKADGIVEIYSKNLSYRRGISNTKDWSWPYINGINHIKIAAPIIINTKKAKTLAIDSETL